MTHFTEATIEQATIGWLKNSGYEHSPDHTLASLRDSLLSKLMRGEVRVKDVEEI